MDTHFKRESSQSWRAGMWIAWKVATGESALHRRCLLKPRPQNQPAICAGRVCNRSEGARGRRREPEHAKMPFIRLRIIPSACTERCRGAIFLGAAVGRYGNAYAK